MENKPTKYWVLAVPGQNPRLVYEEEPGVFRAGIRGHVVPLNGGTLEEAIRKLVDYISSPATGYTFEVLDNPMVGEIHPRVWRSSDLTRKIGLDFEDHQAMDASIQVGMTLFQMLENIFHVIEPVIENEKAYGHLMRQLLILSATEVEASMVGILRRNKYPEKGTWGASDYRKLLPILRLGDWEVAFHYHTKWPRFKPFAAWADGASSNWYEAYNKVKHDRELHLDKATLAMTIKSVAAFFVMGQAQFGGWWQERFPQRIFKFKALPKWDYSERYWPHPEIRKPKTTPIWEG